MPVFVGIDGGGEVEKAILEPPKASSEQKAGIEVPPLRQTVSVG